MFLVLNKLYPSYMYLIQNYISKDILKCPIYRIFMLKK